MHTRYEGIFADWEIAVARTIVNNHRMMWPSLAKEDEDFLLNGCLYHWHRRRRTHREEGEASLRTYMGKVLKNYLISYLRMVLAEKRRTNLDPDSLDRPLDPEDQELTLMDKVSAERPQLDPRLRLDVKASLDRLSPRQREICLLLMAKDTKTDIAAEIGVSRDTIHQELNRIRELFRRDGLEK